jgi:SnoaL-like domain
MPTTDSHQPTRDALLTLFFATDRRDWDTVRALLADRVTLDYTSLNGGAPATLRGDDVVTAWKALLPGFDATHHHITVITSSARPDGSVDIVANGTATHRLATTSGEPLWTIAGYYNANLTPDAGRWTITALTFTATWGSGNQHLVAAAQQRAAESEV